MAITRRKLDIKPVKWDYRITAPHFTASFSVSRNGRVSRAEPVIHSFVGKRIDAVRNNCGMNGWELVRLTPVRKTAEDSLRKLLRGQ